MSIDRLYKYGKLTKYSEQLFTTGSIWFSTAEKLNDPFECAPNFQLTHNPEKIMSSIFRGLQHRYPHLLVNDLLEMAANIYNEDRHRDNEVWKNMGEDMINVFRKKVGLYCLSERRDSILMWSHYADEHLGYCIGFTATDYTPMFGRAQKVDYSEKYPLIDHYVTPIEEQAKLAFQTKFTDWKYEKEWRIIEHQNGSGVQSYPHELMESVTFGLRMEKKEKELIRSWTNQRKTPVRFYESMQGKTKFELTFNEVT